MRILIISAITVLMLFLSIGACVPEEEMIIKKKEISGTLSTARPNYLSIVYESDKRAGYEKEMMFMLDDKVKFLKKNLVQMKEGDEIGVKYEEYFRKTEEGKEEFVKRVTKEVRFIKPASTGLKSDF